MKRTSAISEKTPGPHRVFGLSIDDTVQWATALSGPEKARLWQIEVGTFEDIRVAGPWRPGFDLQEPLATALQGLDVDFGDCAAIGVATTGVVDRRKKVLRSIAFANLLPQGGEPLVDFRALFGKTLGVQWVRENGTRLSVQNEVTAIALAEYALRPVKGTMLYLRFHEGVNGGIIVGKVPLRSQLNIELGHVSPQPHPKDRDFRGVCPVHGSCYEGLASNARLRRSWPDIATHQGVTISDFPEGHEAWGIIAYYIARLCLEGALFLAPAQIILGGDMVCGHPFDDASRNKVYRLLFPLIDEQFKRLNGSYVPYAPANFIKRGLITADPAMFGALRVAEAAIDPSSPVNKLYVIHGGKDRVF